MPRPGGPTWSVLLLSFSGDFLVVPTPSAAQLSGFCRQCGRLALENSVGVGQQFQA